MSVPKQRQTAAVASSIDGADTILSRVGVTVLMSSDSELAQGVASHLFRTFTTSPLRDGARMPVRFITAPEQLGLVEMLTAEHEVFVALVDSHMTSRMNQVNRDRAKAWANLAVTLNPESTLLVALDKTAFELDQKLARASFVRAEHLEAGKSVNGRITMHLVVRLLKLMSGGVVETTDGGLDYDALSVPTVFFISHAKVDLATDGSGPVPEIIQMLAESPIEHWYDTQNIQPGQTFDNEIETGVQGSTVLVCVLTDDWSSREWCRREMLLAKRYHVPVVIVNAMTEESLRLFPYVGNAPVVTWTADSGTRVVLRCLLEALRFAATCPAPAVVLPDAEVPFRTFPELLTVASLPQDTKVVWYPDPPLGREELDVLRSIRPDVDFRTRLSELATALPNGDDQLLGLSLSHASDILDHGGSTEHLATFADDLTVYALLAGLRIAYGGMIGHGVIGDDGRVPGDTIPYVERLFELVRSYGQPNSTSEESKPPIEHWVGWPMSLREDPAYVKLYGTVAIRRGLDRPGSLELTDDDLGIEPGAYFERDNGPRGYAWALSMTDMREQMTTGCDARLVLGGKLTGYGGLLPGVLQEGLLAIKAGRPVYILGAFGGAARLLGELLQGSSKPIDDGWSEEHRVADSLLREQYSVAGQSAVELDSVEDWLREKGDHGLSSALQNGLSDEENLELFHCDDSLRGIELILRGLAGSL